jgi:hypothetical protein
MHRAIPILAALLAASAGGVQAQRLPPPLFRVDREGGASAPVVARVAGTPSRSPFILGLGGIAGAAVGVMAGGWVGGKAREGVCEDCALGGLLYGAVAGESAALPVGVHLANGRRGRLGPSLLASLALGGAGLGAAALTNEYGILLAVPVAQLVSAIAIERATSR